MPTHSYLEEGTDASQAKDHSRPDHKDDGYMPMLPGGAPATPTSKSGDYMPMSPKVCLHHSKLSTLGKTRMLIPMVT